MHVVLHDVAEANAAACVPLMRALSDRLGSAWSAAVTACWHGRALATDDSVVGVIRETGVEVLAHGWTHHNPSRTPLAGLTGGADEFSVLNRAAAIDRGRRARATLEALFAAPVLGFVPPAWQWGAFDTDGLAEAGYRFGVGWSAYWTVDGRRVPLATRSWDGGRWRGLGRVIDLAGRGRAWLAARAVPCIVLHPDDLARGFGPTAFALIEGLLASGHRPLRFAAHA